MRHPSKLGGKIERLCQQKQLTLRALCQISDLKYFESEAARLYNINSIPATFLIGPDGKIVAKNLRGQSLEKKLEEIFG